MHALVYCNFLKKVRLGGWGTEGAKASTLGQYVSACTTFPLGSVSIYIVLRLGLFLHFLGLSVLFLWLGSSLKNFFGTYLHRLTTFILEV